MPCWRVQEECPRVSIDIRHNPIYPMTPRDLEDVQFLQYCFSLPVRPSHQFVSATAPVADLSYDQLCLVILEKQVDAGNPEKKATNTGCMQAM